MNEQETHNDFESLCAGYVLGALSEEEKRTFEKMLDEASPEQIKIYRQMVRIKDDLSLAADPMEPSENLFDNILDEISTGKATAETVTSGPETSESSSSTPSNIIPMWVFKAAAAVLLAGVLGLALYSQQQSTLVVQQEAQISDLQSELEQQNQMLTQLETELERKE